MVACIFGAGVASCAGVKDAYAPPPPGALASESAAHERFATEHRWGAAAVNRWEPVNAADPTSHWVYQMTTDQRPDLLLFRASNDGGRTWAAPRHICRRGTKVPFQYDPEVAVARGGTIDVVCLDGFNPGVVFTQSHDRGRTWSRDVRLDGSLRYSDKPTLVISPSGKDVYVAFNARLALYVAASHDAGATWNAPVVATTAHLWYYSYSGTVAPNGAIWFAIDGEAGKNQTGDGHVALATSADRGATWREIPFAVTHEGAPCTTKNCYPDFFTGEDAVAADKAGNYVFVFAKNEVKQGPNALYASRSRDGVTWSEPAPIANQGNSTSPAIEAGPLAGDFRLVWQDNRNGPQAFNTWYSRSTDAGASWSASVRLSDRVAGAPYKHADGYDFPFGDYLGLSVDSEGYDHVIWGEGAGVYYPGGTWWTRD